MAFVSRKDLRAPKATATPSCKWQDDAILALQGRFEPRTAGTQRRAKGSTSALRGLPFASLVMNKRGGAAEKEERTGTVFPKEFCHLSKSNCPVLTGIGARRKKLLGMKNIDVYALGFYIDPKAAQKTLGPKYGSHGPEQLSSNQNLCEDVIGANEIEKTIRIVVTSGMVNHDKFLSGLKDSLVPACEQAGDTESLQQFEQLFEGAKFRKGLELAFTSTKAGGLAARIDNRDVGEVAAPAFTRAFFSLYLGNNPVSPDGKASISQGLASLVQSQAVDAGKGVDGPQTH